MPSPTTVINRFDLSLTMGEFNLEMNRRGYIGHRVFPPLAVGRQSAEFARIPVEALLTPVEDTKRKPKSGYNRDDYEWETDSYATNEHGVEETLDERQVRIYRNEINAEMIARDRAVNRVLQAYEVACAAAALDTGYFTGAYTAALGTPWSTAASADPIDDIDDAREAFITNCGMKPNALVMEHKAFIAMIRTDRVEDLIKYSGNTDPTALRRAAAQLSDLLQIERLIIADSPVKNTAGRGATPTLGRVWDSSKVLMARIYDGNDLEAPEAQLGRTIQWSEEAGPLPGAEGEAIGVIVEQYGENAVRGDVVRARTDYQIKRLHKPAGYLLTNVVA